MTSWRRALTFNVVVLSAASLLNDISSEMIIPLLPFYLLALHADVFVIGLIEGAGESLLAVVRVVSGHRSDTVGRRKAFISGGYGLSTIAKGLLSVATVWPQVLASRVGDRFGKGVRDPPRDALLAESTPEETRGTAFGFHRSMDTTGAILGPLLALALVGAGLAVNSVFLLAAIPAAAAFGITFLLREHRRAPVRRPLFGSLGALPPALRRYLAVSALFSVGYIAMALFLVRGCELQYGQGACDSASVLPSMIALYVAFNVVYAGLSYVVGRLSDRIGRRPILIAGYAAFGVVSMLFIVADARLLLPLFLALGLAIALVDGSQRAFVVDLSPPERKGLSLGAYHGLTAGMRLLSGLLAGALYVGVGPEAAFGLAAGLALAASAGLALLVKPPTRSGSPSA